VDLRYQFYRTDVGIDGGGIDNAASSALDALIGTVGIRFY
jgi:hypothetical protein